MRDQHQCSGKQAIPMLRRGLRLISADTDISQTKYDDDDDDDDDDDKDSAPPLPGILDF